MALTVETVRVFRAALSDGHADGDPDVALGLIRELEEVRNAITAAQAALTVVVHEAQTAADRDRGIDANETARVVGSQVALARRTSPRLGRRFLGVAKALEEMPHSRDALRSGVIGEWQASQLVAQTAFLTLADRQRVDDSVKGLLGDVSDRRLLAAAQAAAYRADPEAFTARRAKAESERRVSLRPAPDCMTLLTALLPVADGVACYAALTGAGQSPSSAQDLRGKGARMADALVERITGRRARLAPEPATAPPATAPPSGSFSDTAPPPSPVAVNLLVPMEALTGEAEGHLEGFGSLPADVVREFLTAHEAAGGPIRRVFTIPGTGELVSMDSRARFFPGLMAAFVRLRDQVCRTPYCGGPISQIDHITPHAQGGRTVVDNGGGLCASCNYAKEHPDLHVAGTADQITVRTRGIEATSRPPSPPGQSPKACAPRVYTRRIRLRV